MIRIETVIVGAGLSGLACASRLEKHKKEYLIVEKSNRVGGRVESVYENNHIFDVGFQVYNTAYTETNRLLDLKSIDLQLFKPGSVIHDGSKFHMISDPIRDPKNLFSSLLSSLSTFSDKFKVLLLIYELSNYRIENDSSSDVTTLEYLRQRKFSDRFIDLFFSPFFSGIFLEKDLITSSKFFKYVFSNFSNGMACIPKNGMQTIPDSMTEKINTENILLNHSLMKVTDKKILSFSNHIDIKADNIVFTGDSEQIIGKKSAEYNSVSNLYFVTDIDIVNGKYIHLFPKDDLINNIAILNKISPSYCGSNNLLSISILGDYKRLDLPINTIKKRLSNYFGGLESNYDLVKRFDLKKATIIQKKDFFKQRNTFLDAGIILAGERVVNGSIEGAVCSGLNASNYIIEK
jgi:hypothetical protein